MKPLKCKHCGHVIQEPPIIIGESPSVRQAKTIQLMMQHLNEAGAREMQSRSALRKPHAHAMSLVIGNTATISNYLMAANFDLTEELEATREAGRHSIHEATRKVRITNDELADLFESYLDQPVILNGARGHDLLSAIKALRNLRDRYEGLGKYAPAQPATPQAEKQPEEVKQ